jgi:hypothetical protein
MAAKIIVKIGEGWRGECAWRNATGGGGSAESDALRNPGGLSAQSDSWNSAEY